MGADDGQSGEEPVHRVTLDSLWVDKAEVANKQSAPLGAVKGHIPSVVSAGRRSRKVGVLVRVAGLVNRRAAVGGGCVRAVACRIEATSHLLRPRARCAFGIRGLAEHVPQLIGGVVLASTMPAHISASIARLLPPARRIHCPRITGEESKS